MSQLTTFVRPVPHPTMMKLLVYVNRWLNLRGTFILKWIPLVNKIPLVRGFCDITHIQMSLNSQDKLRSYINSQTVAFIGPNHPEFYTDWMLDKEISARVAPLMASWATHDVVNGMGKTMQKFWLKNNLIAQIPGTGNKEAKDYSIEHAMAGHGVLLHPEGHVGWHSDKIAPLFSGIYDMAYQSYQNCNGQKPVYIIPIIWKLSFNKNVTSELHGEFNYIEKQLSLESSRGFELNERLYQLFFSIFHLIAMKHDIIFEKNEIQHVQEKIVYHLSLKIAKELNYSLTGHVEQDIKNLHKFLKSQKENLTHYKILKNMLEDLNNVYDFKFHYYGKTISQENIAELLQKIRIRFCTKGFRNIFHKFIPIPISSRTAFIEVPSALLLNELIKQGKNKDDILLHMQNVMQQELDKINNTLKSQHKVYSYLNLLN